MNLIFASKQEETEALNNATDVQKELVKRQTAKRDGTLTGNGVIEFSYKKTIEGYYVASAEYCGKTITLQAYSKQGLKLLVATYLLADENELTEKSEQINNKAKEDVEQDWSVKLGTTIKVVNNKNNASLTYHTNDTKVLIYNVHIDNEQLNTKLHYDIETGIFIEALGSDKQKLVDIFDYIPQNIIFEIRAIQHARKVNSNDVEVLKDDIRAKAINSELVFYTGVSEYPNMYECKKVTLSNLKDNVFIISSKQVIMLANYLSDCYCDIEYMDILKAIEQTINNELASTSYSWVLTDHTKQSTTISQLNRIDTLFVNYFVNNSEVQPFALFINEVDNTGLVRAYSLETGHVLLHPDVKELPPLEQREYSLLLDALREFNYNINVLNKN